MKLIDIRTWFTEAHALICHSNDIHTELLENPHLVMQVILANVLNKTRPWIISHFDQSLTKEQANQADKVLNRILTGEPLAYVLGKQEFYGLDFFVSPDVLIPRPETEQLVDMALAYLNKHKERRLALDIGTGSGCIAISLCANIPDITVIATDISFPALCVARLNRDSHLLSDRIQFVQADLFPPVKQAFSLICANLPYIPTQTLPELRVSHYEPSTALDGGISGIQIISRMISQLKYFLAQEFFVLLEIQNDQAHSIHQIVSETLPVSRKTTLRDLAGHDRIICIEG